MLLLAGSGGLRADCINPSVPCAPITPDDSLFCSKFASKTSQLILLLCSPVLRYFQSAPAPFQYLLASDGSIAAPVAGLEPAQLARSTLRGLQLLPQVQWPLAAALPALLQHAEADVRWCAVECASLVFGLRDASRSKVGCFVCCCFWGGGEACSILLLGSWLQCKRGG